MKSYQKPSLEIVTFEVNEAIASCDSALGTLFNSGDCNLSDLGEMLWGVGVNFTGDSNCSAATDDYCYYTSTSTETSGILASS